MTKTIKNKIIVADINSGELIELKPINNKTQNLIYIEKSIRFVKIFNNLINIIHTFNKNELIILQYIFKNIKPNKLNIVIHPKYTNQHNTTFTNSINKLIKKNILNKTETKFHYKINPDMCINGKYYNQSEALNQLFKPI